jgi:hypothetical protein
VLIWNERKLDATPFLRGYEDLLLTLRQRLREGAA